MNRTEYQRFPDGARVRFTDEAREAMRKRPGTTRPLRTPADGPVAVYTVDNTDDNLHDVVLRETGERYGTYWLEPAATPGREAADHYLATGHLDPILDFDATAYAAPTAASVTETAETLPEGTFDPFRAIVESDPDIALLDEFFDRELPISLDPNRTGRTELDERRDLRRNKPILQSFDQLSDAFPGLDDLRSSTEKFVFRLRGVERLLAMRRLGWADAHPPIVTICGSTRFRAEMAETNRELTLAGCMVLAPGVFAHDGDEITEEQKAALDELHLRKIDLADQVFVVDSDGYIGESTRREIAYAEKTGTPVAYLSEGGQLDEEEPH
ncbi:hypothetical protein [Brevibacterium oceani]|uniref:hypothetical protein n=1 Tax=Brevibacterium oceani TaxID=358099 RepID=UPI002811F90B|nr:hypothetical protein [Brevibacterium oceani]